MTGFFYGITVFDAKQGSHDLCKLDSEARNDNKKWWLLRGFNYNEF